MKKIVRNMDTESNRAFWKSAEETAAEVEAWPDWKRAGINVSDMRQAIMDRASQEASEWPEWKRSQDVRAELERIKQMSMIGSNLDEPNIHSQEWEEMERLRQELKENEGVIKCLRRQRNEAEARVEELENALVDDVLQSAEATILVCAHCQALIRMVQCQSCNMWSDVK